MLWIVACMNKSSLKQSNTNNQESAPNNLPCPAALGHVGTYPQYLTHDHVQAEQILHLITPQATERCHF